MSRPSKPAVGRRALGAAAGALLLAGLLAGLLLTVVLPLTWGGEPAEDRLGAPPVASTAPAARAPAEPVLARSRPVRIEIPKIGVSAPVTRLGLRPGGEIEEPPLSRPGLAGWYREGPSPGELGPSVILGHVDAHGKAAVFFRLKDLRPGDEITVTREDGTVAAFTVQRLQQVRKSEFPARQVYGENTGHASLRLVTCGGDFDRRTGHYISNVIAYARLVTT